MTRFLLPLAALVAAAIAAPLPASAASQCSTRDSVTRQLTERFGESRQAIGLASEVAVVELYVSPGGSWTLLATDARGLSCVIGAGEAWQAAPQKIAGLDS
jgi:hypothetical protein